MKRQSLITPEAQIAPAEPIVVVPGVAYTPQETAAFFKIKVETLEVWRTTGRYPDLRFKKVGGAVRYMGQDILTFLNGEHMPAAPYVPKNPRSKLLTKPRRRRSAR